MGVDKRGRQRSEAQEAAARKNLAKGNKKAYTKPPAEPDPPASKPTIRAKPDAPAPKPRRTPPRSPTRAKREPAADPPPAKSGGGFWSGIAEGLRG